MAAWPSSIDLDNHLTVFNSRSIKPSNRQTSVAGYTMAFPRGTVVKKAFDFTISYLSNTQRETLQTFFDNNQGVSFTIDFTCTGDTNTYNVVFNEDEINFQYLRRLPNSQYNVELSVREV